jgi:hypothetical protein
LILSLSLSILLPTGSEGKQEVTSHFRQQRWAYMCWCYFQNSITRLVTLLSQETFSAFFVIVFCCCQNFLCMQALLCSLPHSLIPFAFCVSFSPWSYCHAVSSALPLPTKAPQQSARKPCTLVVLGKSHHDRWGRQREGYHCQLLCSVVFTTVVGRSSDASVMVVELNT